MKWRKEKRREDVKGKEEEKGYCKKERRREGNM